MQLLRMKIMAENISINFHDILGLDVLSDSAEAWVSKRAYIWVRS